MTRHSVGVALGQAGGFLATRPDWFLERLAALPSTNVRIFVTLVVFLATALRYLTATDGWTPSLEWVGLLLGMAGVDAAQFLAKRRTHPEYLRARNGYHEALETQNGAPEGSYRADGF